MVNFPVNTKTLEEALQLSEEILTSIELETTSLSSCMLKASRLARLLNDFEYQQIFQYENGGYPNYDKQSSLYQKNFQLLRLSNRTYEFTLEDNTIELHTYNESVKVIEEKIKVSESLLHNLIVKNADLNVFMDKYLILKEQMERRRSFLYEYVCTRYYELKYAKISTDIFSRTRLIVDDHIGKIVPEAAHKFASIYDNLNSENTEGWSNAVHSCRRILQEMADVIYPPKEDKVIKGKTIKLGVEHYINRLIAYVEEHADSETFENIVGSNLSYLGERLNAIYKAANKGSHEIITTKEEADRYVIYTYLIIGDILSLNKDDPKVPLINE